MKSPQVEDEATKGEEQEEQQLRGRTEEGICFGIVRRMDGWMDGAKGEKNREVV